MPLSIKIFTEPGPHSKKYKSSSSKTVVNTASNITLNTTSYTFTGTTPIKNYDRTLGFEHIYVVHLEHRRDRLFKMMAIEKELDVDFEYFMAVNLNDSETLNKYGFHHDNPNHKACYVSHYRILDSIVRNGYKSSLILEDDVDLEVFLFELIKDVFRLLPTDWEMIYLGHCNSGEDRGDFMGEALDFKVYKSSSPACTHGYAVSLSGAKKLLRELIDGSLPYDLQIRGPIRSGNIKSYTLIPSAIIQWIYGNPSDISPGGDSWTYPLKQSIMQSLGFKAE
ncbi:8140_t:CDS:1 [Acaulospora morrowiae]|uniref:8140_t:CDS:1 n=1 Tax=Acaulospora morrowiae TaxID=94023 RepID=A0A9N9FU65_9GLOM|nr:8140_t:CDS:1 [Acaulospora morrowiae]